MTASTPEEIKAYRLLALRAGLKLESVGMKMSKGRSAFSIVKKMTGLPGRSAKELLPLYEDLLREYGILSLKKTMMNPAGREIGSLPEQGKYTSFKKWAAAVKKIGGRLRSESPVRQTVYGPFGFISEWNGRSGKIEEFFDANPVRQRKAWKIQTGSGNGWSDIKVSSGTDFYRNWHFKTKPDAQSELNELARIHGDPESYRIVPVETEQDFDLYNPVHRNNPVRQRIAVSLSRSQVRRNPFNDRNLDA